MRSLYGKFLLFTVITMIGSALIAFLIVNTYYHQFLKSENDAKNMNVLNEITSYVEANENLDLHQYLTTQANVGYKLVLTKNDAGEMRMETFGEPFRSFNLDVQVIEDILDGANYHGMRDLPKETFVTGFFADELANSVGTSFTWQDETYALFLRPNIKMLFSEVHYLLGGLFVGMGILSLLAMIFVARQLIKPLRQLTKATETIGAGHFEVPITYDSRDEIGQLAHSFRQMTKELAKADLRQKQFIADVSHDLQTPLQQIKGYASLMKDNDLTGKKEKDYPHIIEREAERLSNLSRQLLTLTSLDTEHTYKKMTTFSLDEQIKSILRRFRWQLEHKNITIIADIEAVKFVGIEAFLEQLWENLLSNAIKYTETGGSISLTLYTHEENVVFTIEDEGIGIPKRHLPHLFDRFYRVDDARSSHVEGTGLGLAIAKRIVDIHEGTIEFQSEMNKGTKAIVTF